MVGRPFGGIGSEVLGGVVGVDGVISPEPSRYGDDWMIGGSDSCAGLLWGDAGVAAGAFAEVVGGLG